MRIKERIQLCVLAVDREGVLTEVVRSDTEEINLFCQLIADDGSRRGLDHDTLLWISVLNALLSERSFYFLHNRFDLANLADTCDHWIHNGNFSICACAEQRAKLCLEDLRPRQADADRTAAKCRVLLFFHLEIIALFIGTDIEGTDDDAFSRHRLCCLFVDTELLLLCWIVILLKIDKLASEQADAARVVLHDSRKVFDVSDISIQQNFLSIQCNIFFSL